MYSVQEMKMDLFDFSHLNEVKMHVITNYKIRWKLYCIKSKVSDILTEFWLSSENI